jgi:hypothetical protein
MHDHNLRTDFYFTEWVEKILCQYLPGYGACGFFLKLTNLVIFFGGAGAALRSDYNASKEANWLTLTWNVADQLNNALTIFFQILLALVVVFLILYLVARKKNNP